MSSHRAGIPVFADKVVIYEAETSPQFEGGFMRNYRVLFMSFLAVLLAVYIVGCGQETVSLPSVVSVTPTQGATSVSVNTPVTATFSVVMNSASITTSTFALTAPDGTAIAGAVTYSGKTATLTPTASLAYSTTYTATITSGVKTPGGAALVAPFVWTFTTTAATPVIVAPVVSSTLPANGATTFSLVRRSVRPLAKR
jgi:hypothetical protein